MLKEVKFKNVGDTPSVRSWEDSAKTSGEKLSSYNRIEWRTRELAGRILTIIDAVISEPKQNKATKDLVKNEIRELLYGWQEYCFEGKCGHSIPNLEDNIN